MKGLILSGGMGTRLLSLTYRRAKQLIPIANEPVLCRVIRTIRDAGITEIGIVVGDTEPEIREAVNGGERWGVNITYIRQSAPAGLAHAVPRDHAEELRQEDNQGKDMERHLPSPIIIFLLKKCRKTWNAKKSL